MLRKNIKFITLVIAENKTITYSHNVCLRIIYLQNLIEGS